MAKLFKDFNKDTKDLLSKNYQEAGSWKVESKGKAGDKTWVINPTADAKGISVDVDYNMKEYNLKTKTNLASNGNVKPKITWEQKGHKVETTVMSLSADAKFEIVYEGVLGDLAAYDKVTRDGCEAGVSYPVGPIAVGGSANFAFGKGLKSWSAGARWAQDGRVVNFTTTGLKTFTTGVYSPLVVAGHKAVVAAQIDCGGGKFKATVGTEAALCCFKLRVKATNAGDVSFAVIKEFADKWKAAVSMNLNECCKFGVLLTRE